MWPEVWCRTLERVLRENQDNQKGPHCSSFFSPACHLKCWYSGWSRLEHQNLPWTASMMETTKVLETKGRWLVNCRGEQSRVRMNCSLQISFTWEINLSLVYIIIILCFLLSVVKCSSHKKYYLCHCVTLNRHVSSLGHVPLYIVAVAGVKWPVWLLKTRWFDLAESRVFFY